MAFVALSPWLSPILAQNEAGEGASGLFGSSFMLPMLMMLIAFYFLMILPDQRKRKEHDKLLKNLKKNDQIVTTGGIVGIVVNASPDSPYVVVRVDENTNTRMRILRSAILQVGGVEEGSEKSPSEASAD